MLPTLPSLEIEYRPAYWAHRLLAAIQTKQSLSEAHSHWSKPESGLADLAFSIETRIGNLREIIRLTDENLHIVGEEIASAPDIDALVAGGYAYRVENEVALRRALIGFNAFIAESRSIFENLACFYQAFARNYFGENVSDTDRYAKIASLSPTPTWADDLRLIRHDILHYRSPWLRFEVRSTSPKYDPVLVLDWRPSSTAVRAEVAMRALKDFRGNLLQALTTLRDELIARVNAVP
jgi:hypothetical protein